MGDAEAPPGRLHQQAGQDGQGDGDAEAELTAGPRLRVHLDPAPHRGQAGPDDVEPDPPARHLRHRRGRRQPGAEDRVDGLLVADAVEGVAGLAGALADPGKVDAAAVVGHRHHDLGAELGRVDPDRAPGRLARRQPRLGWLDAVVDGVADQVEQGVGDPLEHAPVELGVLAPQLQLDRLAERVGQVAPGPAQRLGDGGEGDHAGLQGPLLEALQDPGQVVQLGDAGRVDPSSSVTRRPTRRAAADASPTSRTSSLHGQPDGVPPSPGRSRRPAPGRRGRPGRGLVRLGLGGWRGLRARRRVAQRAHQPVGLVGAVVAGEGGRDQLTHPVDGAEHRVDHRRGGGAVAAAQPLQDLLHGVGDPEDVGHPDHRGRPLQGVRLPEHRGEQLAVVAVALQLQQQLAQGGQAPLGLLGEHGPEARLLAGDLHVTSRPGGGAGP
jgi:hypothetical protein